MGEKIGDSYLKVAESGIDQLSTIKTFKDSGFKGFLMGEYFMRQPNPALFFADFAIFEHIFFRLKAMPKKAKSILTLSIPNWRKRLYAMSYFICPKTASGSIHLRPRCLIPSSEVSLSRALRRYSLSVWLTSIVRSPFALKQLPLNGHPSHRAALYLALSVT